ncbi:helix-turn-helix domain-containing protein [Streptomyces sp. NPDC058865]|uniref:helix-turn-helix domain-containing protein n=1 Tax=Streptomyces sp. NPDC058865 TaxID=3346655 RepID=UPI00369B28AC
MLPAACGHPGSRGSGRWIIRRRLEGARGELAVTERAPRTIEAVARSWGFPNPAHFTRRFRMAYGVTPGEWTRLARQGGLPPNG